MPTEPWLGLLLQTSDPLFPTGAYAHSFGLEELVRLDVVRDEASLADFILKQVLPGLENFELPLLRLAHQSAARAEKSARELTGGSEEEAAFAAEIGQLCAIDSDLDAWKIARETREASAQIGGRRLQMLLKIAPGPLLEAFGRRESHNHHLVVFALQMARAPLEATMTAYVYQSLAAFCSAALKLIRIGQEGCQRVLSRGMAAASGIIDRAIQPKAPGPESSLAAPAEPGWFNPLWEIASMRHEFAFERLFIS